jgi:hypothetical protein
MAIALAGEFASRNAAMLTRDTRRRRPDAIATLPLGWLNDPIINPHPNGVNSAIGWSMIDALAKEE